MPFQTFQFLSKSDDKRQCTKVDLSAIQAMLRAAHNVFAEFKVVGLPFDYRSCPGWWCSSAVAKPLASAPP